MTHPTPGWPTPPHLTPTWPTSPLHDPPHPCMTCSHSWIFKTLWVIISWVWVICKRLNVKRKKIHSTPPLHDSPHPCMTHPTSAWPSPSLHDPPHPTPAWAIPPHLTPIWPTWPYPIHTWPILPLYDQPHPCMTHPTPTWHTPPHPWYIFGHKRAFFHGLLHYGSLSVDNNNWVMSAWNDWWSNTGTISLLFCYLFSDVVEDGFEAWSTVVAIIGREVGTTNDRAQVWGQPHTHRPPSSTTSSLITNKE